MQLCFKRSLCVLLRCKPSCRIKWGPMAPWTWFDRPQTEVFTCHWKWSLIICSRWHFWNLCFWCVLFLFEENSVETQIPPSTEVVMCFFAAWEKREPAHLVVRLPWVVHRWVVHLRAAHLWVHPWACRLDQQALACQCNNNRWCNNNNNRWCSSRWPCNSNRCKVRILDGCCQENVLQVLVGANLRVFGTVKQFLPHQSLHKHQPMFAISSFPHFADSHADSRWRLPNSETTYQ